MSQKRIQQIEQRIDRIKRALLEIGPMRPGSLTRQGCGSHPGQIAHKCAKNRLPRATYWQEV